MKLIHADAALIAKYNLQHEREQDKAGKLIEDAPTVNGWISVKDRLPRSRQWVLCKGRAGIYEVLRYEETCDGERWHHDNRHNYMIGFVTHWMPLPEPPEEEK